MKRKLIFGVLILCLVLVSSLGFLAISHSLAAPAAPAAGYQIGWWTVDNGGGLSQGGVYVLQGTAGQAEPGVLTGSVYRLTGGYWSSVPTYQAFFPLLSK